MSALDNLEAAIKAGKVQYDSIHPQDKVVYTDTITITNDGNTGTSSETAKIVETSIPNPYGKQCYVRYKWAVDGTNFNAALTHLVYTFTIHIVTPSSTSTPIKGLSAAVSVGSTDSSIIFRTANGLHGNVTRATSSSPDSYTPTSQTFTIQYALYERL